jgi:hypothetical protein
MKQYFYDRHETKLATASTSNGTAKQRLPSSEIEVDEEIYAASSVSSIKPSAST